MALGRKTGGRNFQKGQVSNPNGAIGMPKEVREARKLTQNEFVKIACNLIKSTRNELQEVLDNQETTALELMIGNIIVKAIDDKDHQRAEFLLNRIIGRVAISADINMTQDKTPVVNFGIDNQVIDVPKIAANNIIDHEENMIDSNG